MTTTMLQAYEVPKFCLQWVFCTHAARIYCKWLIFCKPRVIGACRAVWVPGQDLATLHLMRNCGKRVFVTTLYAIRTSVYAYAICW